MLNRLVKLTFGGNNYKIMFILIIMNQKLQLQCIISNRENICYLHKP